MRTFVSQFDRPARARAGVSLFSVLVILVGIAFVAGWAIPAFFSQPDVTLDNAANLLVRDVRTAQNRAMWSGIDAYLRFDDDGGGYGIVDSNGRPLERLGALGDWDQRYEEGGVFDGVRIVRVDAGPDRALLFDAKKRHWEGGEIELGFRGDTRVVRVTPHHGEVTVLAIARTDGSASTRRDPSARESAQSGD